MVEPKGNDELLIQWKKHPQWLGRWKTSTGAGSSHGCNCCVHYVKETWWQSRVIRCLCFLGYLEFCYMWNSNSIDHTHLITWSLLCMKFSPADNVASGTLLGVLPAADWFTRLWIPGNGTKANGETKAKCSRKLLRGSISGGRQVMGEIYLFCQVKLCWFNVKKMENTSQRNNPLKTMSERLTGWFISLYLGSNVSLDLLFMACMECMVTQELQHVRNENSCLPWSWVWPHPMCLC